MASTAPAWIPSFAAWTSAARTGPTASAEIRPTLRLLTACTWGSQDAPRIFSLRGECDVGCKSPTPSPTSSHAKRAAAPTQ
ncbi:hypothetical protein F5883DRAFT_559725 [Diaporthe sp. PMI_573]|nr:hypothetical protein F5883DRAFT_559725 [Diaporthaceae sp. PMI_573]